MRARPESITVRTPSIVRLVSATFVATMMRRRRDGSTGATARSCSSGGSDPWSGRMSAATPVRASATFAFSQVRMIS